MQFFSFLITGGIAAGVNILSRYILNKILSFEVSVVLAYLLGMITAFILARVFVFTAGGMYIGKEFYRFTIVNIFSLIIVWLISVGLARYLFPAMSFEWHADDVAHLIGVSFPAVTSYFAHKYFTFKM